MNFLPKLLLVLVAVAVSSGCDLTNSDDLTSSEQLRETLNGTWRPVSSFSKRAVDADLDGRSSRDMLDELTNFDNGFLTVQIIEDPISETDHPNLLGVPYPVQAFPPDSELGDPGFYINYLTNYGTARFKVDQTQRDLVLDQTYHPDRDQEEYPYPESVKLERDGLVIEVVIRKPLLTAKGKQTVEIRTRYARVSKNT